MASWPACDSLHRWDMSGSPLLSRAGKDICPTSPASTANCRWFQRWGHDEMDCMIATPLVRPWNSLLGASFCVYFSMTLGIGHRSIFPWRSDTRMHLGEVQGHLGALFLRPSEPLGLSHSHIFTGCSQSDTPRIRNFYSVTWWCALAFLMVSGCGCGCPCGLQAAPPMHFTWRSSPGS